MLFGSARSEKELRFGAIWTLTLLTLSLIVSFMDRQTLNLVVDPIRKDIGITDAQIGLLQGGAFAIFFTIVGLPIGRAVDVYSRKLIVIAGVVVWSAATLSSAFATSLATLFLARVFIGVGEATLLPAGTSLIADAFPPERRATAIAVFFLGTSVGSAIANIAGGALLGLIQSGGLRWLGAIGALAPWRALFCLISLPGFALSLLLLSMREPARGPRMTASTALTGVLRDLWGRRAILAPLYVSLGFTALWSLAVVSWTPTLLSRVFGESPVVLGTGLGVAGFAGGLIGVLTSGPFGDWLASKDGIRGRLLATVVASALGIPTALLGASRNPQLIVVMFGLMCATTSGAGALAATTIQDAVTSEMRGVATVIISVFTTVIGLTLGPWLVGFATEHVFANPLALGVSISCVAFPGAIAATLVLLPAFRRAAPSVAGEPVASEVAKLESASTTMVVK